MKWQNCSQQQVSYPEDVERYWKVKEKKEAERASQGTMSCG